MKYLVSTTLEALTALNLAIAKVATGNPNCTEVYNCDMQPSMDETTWRMVLDDSIQMWFDLNDEPESIARFPQYYIDPALRAACTIQELEWGDPNYQPAYARYGAKSNVATS